jgi:hypothetical protein
LRSWANLAERSFVVTFCKQIKRSKPALIHLHQEAAIDGGAAAVHSANHGKGALEMFFMRRGHLFWVQLGFS